MRKKINNLRFLGIWSICYCLPITAEDVAGKSSDVRIIGEVQQAFDIVKEKLPLIASSLNVSVNNSQLPQAYTDCHYNITVSEGLVHDLEKTGDPRAALMFVLGHEVGHNILCAESKIPMGSHEQEYFADFYGSVVVRSEDRDAGERLALERMETWGPTGHSGQTFASRSPSTHPSTADRQAKLAATWKKDDDASFGAQYQKYRMAVELLNRNDLRSIKTGMARLNEISKYFTDPENPVAAKIAPATLLNLALAKAGIKYYSIRLTGEQRFPLVPLLNFPTFVKRFEKIRGGSKGSSECEGKNDRDLNATFWKIGRHLDAHLKNFPNDKEVVILLGLVATMDYCADYSDSSVKTKVSTALAALNAELPHLSGQRKSEYLNNRAILLMSGCESRIAFNKCDPRILGLVLENLQEAEASLRDLSSRERPNLRAILFNLANFADRVEKNPKKKEKYVTLYRESLDEATGKYDELYHILMKAPAGSIVSRLKEIVPEWLGKDGKSVAAELTKRGYATRLNKQRTLLYVTKNEKAVFRIGLDSRSGVVSAIEFLRDSHQRFGTIEIGKARLSDAIGQGYSDADGTLRDPEVTVVWSESPSENVLIKCKFEKK
jgi:hypothetical protein